MSSIALGSPGHCYVLSNPSFEGVLKIGATTLDPVTRAKQLSAATAAPTPFHVVYSRKVPDVNEAERMMHAAFADRRVNEGREFFRVSVFEAATTMDKLVGGESAIRHEVATPFAELFATFPDDGTPRDLTDAERRQVAAVFARE